MIIQELPLKGAYTLIPEIHKDNRGTFGRIFCQSELKEYGLEFNIVQMNHSVTQQVGALRGMHFQYPPQSEVKIVKCLKGAVYDVVVDIRRDSPTFLKWCSTELSANNMKMVYIPKGFAHGFQVLKQDSELIYLHSEFYSQGNEGAIKFDDPTISIDWPLAITDISERDQNHQYINDEFKGI